MSMTTLRLPASLKARVAALADAADKSPHAYLLEAIEAHARSAEEHAKFVAHALAASKDFSRTRKGYALADVTKYLQARVRGKKVARPKLKTWPK
jgi:predicted transcriptional regulator